MCSYVKTSYVGYVEKIRVIRKIRFKFVLTYPTSFLCYKFV
jgi:hypothetical protein